MLVGCHMTRRVVSWSFFGPSGSTPGALGTLSSFLAMLGRRGRCNAGRRSIVASFGSDWPVVLPSWRPFFNGSPAIAVLHSCWLVAGQLARETGWAKHWHANWQPNDNRKHAAICPSSESCRRPRPENGKKGSPRYQTRTKSPAIAQQQCFPSRSDLRRQGPCAPLKPTRNIVDRGLDVPSNC